MNVENLRYRGIPVFWNEDRLYAEGFAGEREYLADVSPAGSWRAYADTSPSGESTQWLGASADIAVGKVAAVRCLVDNGVLTVVSETPAASAMKFIRLPAPLPWKANEILRTAEVSAIHGDGSTYTVDMPAAKADAIVALLLLLDINVKSYEV